MTLLVTAVALYPFVAAVSLLAWGRVREVVCVRAELPEATEQTLLRALYAVHVAIFSLLVVGISICARQEKEWVVYLFGIGWRLNAFRLLFLQGAALLAAVSVWPVTRDLRVPAAQTQPLRVAAGVLCVWGLTVQAIVGEGIIHPLLVWVVLPAVVWRVGHRQVDLGRNEDGARGSVASLLLPVFAGLPLLVCALLICGKAGSSNGQVVYYALATVPRATTLWLGMLVIASLAARAAVMTVGSWPRRCTGESSAWCACVEVALPWADMFVLLRFVPALLSVQTLRELAAAQLGLGAAIAVAVLLGVAATAPARRPGMPPLNVLALWSVVLVLSGAKSSVAWGCAVAYVLNYCVLVGLAHGTCVTGDEQRRAAAIHAVSLLAAVALPQCLSGQMLLRAGRDLVGNHGWWAIVPAVATLVALVATHVPTKRTPPPKGWLYPTTLWTVALALGAAGATLRGLLGAALETMGLMPRW